MKTEKSTPIIKTAVVLCLALAAFSACAPPRPRTEADTAAFHWRVRVTFDLRDPEGRERGRVWVAAGADRARILFLSPLNQVTLELFVRGEEALLLRRKEGRCWRGPFRRLIHRMWGIDVPWREVRGWLLEGRVPVERLQREGYVVRREWEADGVTLRALVFERGSRKVRLDIGERRRRDGDVAWRLDEEACTFVDLEHLLDDR